MFLTVCVLLVYGMLWHGNVRVFLRMPKYGLASDTIFGNLAASTGSTNTTEDDRHKSTLGKPRRPVLDYGILLNHHRTAPRHLPVSYLPACV